MDYIIGIYCLVFVASLLVDSIPFVGPPAWTVMVFFQMRYGLDIWTVLAIGVPGSAVGRYIYSLYVPFLSHKLKYPCPEEPNALLAVSPCKWIAQRSP